MRFIAMVVSSLLALSACDNFTPTPKVAGYDPVTDSAILPAPCPDWSQSQTGNVLNEPHSNFGCAVNTNSALQLANPQDIEMGHGNNHPDTEITTRVIERYRAGELPLPLTPVQSTGSASP